MSNKSKKSTSEKMALVAQPHGGASTAMSLFKEAGAGVSEGMKVKSRSPMLKPADFPVGRILGGTIKRLIRCVAQAGKTAAGTKYGCLIEIVPDLNTVGVAIPATATLTSALEITESGSGESTEFKCPFIGHRVEIEKLEAKIPSKKGQDAWNFLVAVSEKPVTMEE